MNHAVDSRNPQTRTVAISDVTRELRHLVDEVRQGNTRVLIENSGVPAAALVSIDDLERLMGFDRERAERWELLEMMREPFRGVPAEEIEREAAKAIAEVRAERRAAREARIKSA